MLGLDNLADAGEASRHQINDLVWDRLSGALGEKQAQDKVLNPLTKIRQGAQIRNAGTRAKLRCMRS